MLLAVLSPAKRLDFKSDNLVARGELEASRPALTKDTQVLARRVKRYTSKDLRRLMDLSPALAELNHRRFQEFGPKADTRSAIYAFAGDVYQGFDAKSLSADAMEFAQDHVAILSGLYGLLRPLDLIAPYRLEMHSKVITERGPDLYAFWHTAVADEINRRLGKKKREATIVNLASVEYWGAVDTARLAAPVIQCVFKEIKGGKAQVVSFLAKKARGLMARFMVEERLSQPDDLKRFKTAGYAFDAPSSSADTYVFSRRGK